jgi:membrane dipeptidase
MPPETLLTLGEHLTERAWSASDIRVVLGGNFHRVAQRAWQA